MQGCGSTASRNLEILGIGNHASRRELAMAKVRSCAACAPGGKMHRHGLQGRLESVRKIQRPPPGLVRQKMAQQQRQKAMQTSPVVQGKG